MAQRKLAQMVTAVRESVGDLRGSRGVTHLQDPEVIRIINQALDAWADRRPLPYEETITTVVDQRRYPLEAGVRRLDRVEWRNADGLLTDSLITGWKWEAGDEDAEGTLVLAGYETQARSLTAIGVKDHAEWTDTKLTSTLPERAETKVIRLACGYYKIAQAGKMAQKPTIKRGPTEDTWAAAAKELHRQGTADVKAILDKMKRRAALEVPTPTRSSRSGGRRIPPFLQEVEPY